MSISRRVGAKLPSILQQFLPEIFESGVKIETQELKAGNLAIFSFKYRLTLA